MGNIPTPEKEKDKSAQENTCAVKKPFHIEVTSTKELPQEEVKPICEFKESESYKATKEEIEDSLLFIKNKLKDQPVNDKENVFQDQDYDEVHTEESIVERFQVIQNPNAAAKSFATECIPPVRPQRVKKTSKINVPDWTPPRNDLMTYFFSCIKPKVSD